MAASKKLLRHSKSLQVLYNAGSRLFREPGGEGPARRAAMVILSVVFAFLSSGVIYGFPALRDVLLFKVKAFSRLCLPGDALPCKAQENWIALTVTVATTGVSACAFPVGIFLDFAGPRITVCVASLIFASGLTSIAFANIISDYLYIYGFFALAVGGPAIHTAMTNFSGLFGSKAAAIISAQSGGFQVSSIIMVAIRLAVMEFGFSVRHVFLLYLAVPCAIFVSSVVLFPDRAYGSEEGPGNRGEPHRVWLIRRILVAREEQCKSSQIEGSKSSENDLQSPLLRKSSSFSVIDLPPLAPEDAVPNPPELYNIDFCKQVQSLPLAAITFTVCFFILLVNFYIATVQDQLFQEAVAGGVSGSTAQKIASEYTSLFSLFLPIGGTALIPLIGYCLVRLGLAPTFTIIGVLNFVFLLTTIPNIFPMQWKVVGFGALALARPFVYSAFATYVADIFGFANFGKLFGIAQLGGLLVAPLEYGMVVGVQRYLGGQYVWVNASLLFISMSTSACFVYYLVWNVFSGFFFRPPLPPRQPCILNVLDNNIPVHT